GIEHFLHAGAALGAFVADDDHVASHDLAVQDALDRGFLAFVDAGAAGEGEDAVVHPGRLDDAAVGRQVAVQHRQPAVLRIGVRAVADAARLAVQVQGLVVAVLAESGLAGHAAGRRAVEIRHAGAVLAAHIPAADGLAQRAGMHIAHGQVQPARTGELRQDAPDAAGPAPAVDVDAGRGRRPPA